MRKTSEIINPEIQGDLFKYQPLRLLLIVRMVSSMIKMIVAYEYQWFIYRFILFLSVIIKDLTKIVIAKA